jgi:phosphoribosylaminoimidazole-succinocarboxamide synthase
MKTNEKLDKDVFRRDLGDLITTYKKVLAKIS